MTNPIAAILAEPPKAPGTTRDQSGNAGETGTDEPRPRSLFDDVMTHTRSKPSAAPSRENEANLEIEVDAPDVPDVLQDTPPPAKREPEGVQSALQTALPGEAVNRPDRDTSSLEHRLHSNAVGQHNRIGPNLNDASQPANRRADWLDQTSPLHMLTQPDNITAISTGPFASLPSRQTQIAPTVSPASSDAILRAKLLENPQALSKNHPVMRVLPATVMADPEAPETGPMPRVPTALAAHVVAQSNRAVGETHAQNTAIKNGASLTGLSGANVPEGHTPRAMSDGEPRDPSARVSPIGPTLGAHPVTPVTQAPPTAGPETNANHKLRDARHVVQIKADAYPPASPRTAEPTAPAPTAVATPVFQPGLTSALAEGLRLSERLDDGRSPQLIREMTELHGRVESWSASAFGSTQSTPPTAKAIFVQIAQNMPQPGQSQTDIALNPEELGRVRMSLSTIDGVLTLTVSAERSETLDLMRRYAGDLGQELLALGYSGIDFRFEQQAHQNNQAAHQNGSTPSDEPGDDLPNSQPVISASVVSPGLDIRL